MLELILIRIAAPPESLVKEIPGKHVEFYLRYAEVVAETLSRPSFQRFLEKVIKKENIEKNEIRGIQVIVFPSRSKKGKRLAGSCSGGGQISIYPKGMRAVLRSLAKNKEEKLDFYLKKRAMSTLIHELLHIKYLDDEEGIRELTKNYFDVFNLSRQGSNQRGQRHVKCFKYALRCLRRQPHV